MGSFDKHQTARGSTTSADDLARLATDGDPAVRAAVASNPNTPPGVLWQLASKLAADVLANPVFSLLVLEDPGLVGQIPLPAMLALLEQPAVPVPFLEDAARHRDRAVRAAVARAPATPALLLESLARDADTTVRYAVARNPRCPVFVLERLTADALGGPGAHALDSTGVAANTAAPEYMLEALADVRVLGVLHALCDNARTPPRVLARLARNPNATVRMHVARARQTPADVLDRLSRDDEMRVRAALVENPSTPAAARERVAREASRRQGRATT